MFFNTRVGCQVFTLVGHLSKVTSVAISSDGKRIISGSYDMVVKIWSAETGAEVRCTASPEVGLREGGVTLVPFSVEKALTCSNVAWKID